MLNELLKSRHYRLKIMCLVLIMYTMFNCQALIWSLLQHLNFGSADHINYFGDDDQQWIGIGISCLFSFFAVIAWWIFSFRVIIQYHYKQTDISWMSYTKLLAQIGTLLWICSMLTWIATILFISMEDTLWKCILAIVPEWNRTLVIGWIYCIFYEFNPKISRSIRVQRWISIVVIFFTVYVGTFTLWCGFSWLWFIFALFSGNPQYVIISGSYLILLSILLTPFYNFFFILWDQLRPSFKWKYYMMCVPCCCCFCHDQWCKCCIPPCCYNRPDIKRSVWIITGMSFVWIVCTTLGSFLSGFYVFHDEVLCLAEASLVEYASGFRSAGILIVFYSVLINIELTYSGPIKDRFNFSNDEVALQVRNTTVDSDNIAGVDDNNTAQKQSDDSDGLAIR